MDETELCRRWLPYADIRKTLSLGCKNCGRMPFNHTDICDACDGTARERMDGGWDDEKQCRVCGGTGRASGKLEETL